MNSKQFLEWLEQKSKSTLGHHFQKPLLMGILNVTPDSFYDGGAYLCLEQAKEKALKLIEEGADIIDIGGESTRPGAEPVSLEKELQRVIPLIEAIRRHSEICISIDTYKPEVMQAAINAGASMLNDVFALRQEGALEMAASLQVPICLMHMQGRPYDMQNMPNYAEGIMNTLDVFFAERIHACLGAGIRKNQLLLDPGFGFGKTVSDNLKIMYHLEQLNHFNIPLLLGVSRKHTIGILLEKMANERLIGSIALTVHAALKGVAVIRTHDVDETSQALRILEAIHETR